MRCSVANQLKSGDEVYWNDPDGGECSRAILIQAIEIVGTMFKITDQAGGYLEGYVSELS